MSNALTIRLASLLPARLGRTRTPQGIDLGGGRQLPPEDVLESHYKRLAAASARNASSHEVRIQVAPNLKAAIRVMAPGLAPLADIAEEIATKLNTVEPEPNFRMELHRALEEAHRQMAAQRALQGDTRAWWTSPVVWYGATGLAVAITALGLLVYWRLQRAQANEA